MQSYKEEILKFYDDAVTEEFADTLLSYYKEKKRHFQWLFKDKDRIELSISEEIAVAYFFNNNFSFSTLYSKTKVFLEKQDEIMDDYTLKRSIYLNRITYKKNTYKFSKFYPRFVDESQECDLDFQSFYDSIKTGNVYISINPLDFLSASENCSYSSCFAKDSCHHTATSGFMRDKYTVIVYVKSDNRKIGRQWIYFNDFYLIMGKIYGAISRVAEYNLRKYLESAYAKKLGIRDDWIISRQQLSSDMVENCGNQNNNHGDYATYFDLDVQSSVRPKECTENFSDIYMQFEDGLDKYGDDTREGQMLFNFCYHCGIIVTDETSIVNGEYVCDSCLADNYLWCEECEEYHNNDTSFYYIEDKMINICGECYQNGEYGRCEKTGTFWSLEHLVKYYNQDNEMELVSSQYAQDHFERCNECNEYHNRLVLEDGRLYCRKCYADVIQLKISFEAA